MSALVNHAQRELEAAGLFAADSDYGGMLGNAVIELVNVFAGQGHSGFSAKLTIGLFSKVAAYEPLLPLTGGDNEWMEVADNLWQNKRCSHVFKDKEKAWDIDGKIFREADGASYTSKDSHVTVEFPYAPKSQTIDV